MNISARARQQFTTQRLLRNTAALLIVFLVPSIALASSWSPTLLVNTEAFQSIDDGDGASDIELRFGTTGKELRWNVTTSQFEFDGSVEVQGTASGKVVHAQDLLTSSGGLVVEDDAVFGSGIVLNGVKYIFPFSDASASGKVLSSDGAGNLTWTAAGSTPNVFQTISVSGQSDVVSDQESDTLTFVAGSNVTITTNAGSDTITIASTDTSQATTFTLSADGGSDQTISHGNTLEIAGGSSITTTASATDTVTVDITDDSVNFTELADSLSVDANTTVSLGSNNFTFDASSTGQFEILGTGSGRIFHAQDELRSSGTLVIDGAATFNGTLSFSSITSCGLLTTDSNGQLACDSEGFDESVDDRVASLLQSGSGIVITYDDTNGSITINQGTNSGSQVSLSPEYAGAVYYGDGSNNVGQMVLAYDATNKENYYQWTSTQSSLQDYNIAVRVKVPDDFSHWDGTAPIQFRYRSNAASTSDNQIDVTMLDTAGSAVSLTGGADLANTSWTTATITGPEASGTYTPGSYITIILSMQARTTNSGEAHAGYLNINWSTRPH
ncbi:hypothetical protein H6770_04780 [Candidatus Peribacteria bacterium]|nr:hypothetical protein [Candidatus Peribacteria bacterium]